MNKNTGLLFFALLISCLLPAQNTLVKTSDDELFRTGMELLEREKYGSAREFFQRYTELNRNDLNTIEAEYFIAFCALNLFHADAEKLFENFIAKYPFHSKAASAYYDLGSFYYSNKDLEKTILYFEKADPGRLSQTQKTERSFKLGYSYFAQKEFEKAEPYFNELKVFENKYTYAASYYAGYIEFRSAKYDEALADLKKAEENEAYQPLVPSMIANIYYWQAKYDELITYSEGLFANGEKNIQSKDDIFLLTADAYYFKNDYKKAVEFFEKYTDEHKTKVTPEIRYRLAYSQFKTDNFDAAINNLKDIAGTKDSLSQSAAYYLGISYLKKGNKNFALSAFDQARKSEFNPLITEEAFFTYGKLTFDLQRYHESISAFKDFLQKYSSSEHIPEVQELLSDAFLSTSNYQEAISYIETLKVRSLRINTAYQRVTFYSGVQNYNNGKFQEAIKFFDKSSEFPIDKDVYLGALFWKGESHSALKEYENAINSYSAVFRKTNEENEFFLKSRYGIGIAYFNTKEYDKAFPHFRKYVDRLKNAPKKLFYDDALLRLADLYYQQKKYQEAINHYSEAIKGNIRDMDYAYYQRGVLYGILEKNPEAISSLDAVIKNYPESVYQDDAIFEKSMLQLNAGESEKSIAGFTRIIQEKATSPYVPYAYLKRGVAYTNLGKNDEAIMDYEAILTNYITHPVREDAFIGLQDLYARTGRTGEMDEWIAKMEQVDPKSSLIVTAKFTEGKNLYLAQKYEGATKALTSFITSNPDHPKVTEAKFYLGDSYARTNNKDLSIKYFQEVLDSKDPLYYVRSVQRVADIHFADSNFVEAKNYYSVLLHNARNNREKLNAWNGLMETSYLIKEYDSTIYYAAEIKNFGKATVDAEGKALLYSGKSYYAKQDFEKATDFFISTVNHAKDKYGAEAQYLIAEMQYQQKKHKQSLETLYQLNSIFSGYEEWLNKSFLLIADNFMAMNETFQAKATLNSIIDNSKHEPSVEIAKLKLAELEGKEEETNE